MKLILFIFSILFSFHVLACDEVAFKNCIKFKGGIKCYQKHKCSQDLFQKDFCESFDYKHCLKWKGGANCVAKKKQCKEILSRNNFEGYLPLIYNRSDNNHFSRFGEVPQTCQPNGIIRTNNVRTSENFVDRFIKEAHQFGTGVKTYKLGNYQAHKTDCSGFLMLAMKKMGLKTSGPQFDLAPNFPRHFKKCDPNNLKPGDLLLLNKPGRSPDHWVMVSSKGKWPSGDIEIMDVSSDYYAGKTYYRGKLKKRGNIQARKVFSCVRHKNMNQQSNNIVSI
ncbi:MAG: C40 family peptidase [Bacteriovoracaceae bacterium]|nr:C40 family peptidase [Bacteriovoracaceae bacterium]